MKKNVYIVESEPYMCPCCNSRLQGDLCYQCSNRYMGFDDYLEYPKEVNVLNREECIKIAKRKIRRLEKEKKELELYYQKKKNKSQVARSEIGSLAQEIEELKTKFIVPQKGTENDDTVYVYYQLNNRCIRGKHSIESVTAKTIDMVTGKNIKINVFFCKDCSKYFVNYEALKKGYLDKGIYPTICFENADMMGQLKEISELRLFGYTVQSDKLSASERQEILSRIIDNSLLSKQDIIKKLQFLIRYNGNSVNNMDAKKKWEEDLQFVSRYTRDNKRKIVPRFIRKEEKG